MGPDFDPANVRRLDRRVMGGLRHQKYEHDVIVSDPVSGQQVHNHAHRPPAGG